MTDISIDVHGLEAQEYSALKDGAHVTKAAQFVADFKQAAALRAQRRLEDESTPNEIIRKLIAQEPMREAEAKAYKRSFKRTFKGIAPGSILFRADATRLRRQAKQQLKESA